MLNNLLFLINQASLFLERGAIDSAIICLNKAIKIKPNNSESYRLMGVAYALQKKYAEANIYFDKSLEIDPNNYMTYSNKGNVLKEMQYFQEALYFQTKSLELNSKYEEAWSNKGNIYFDLNEFEMALKCYQAAIDINKNYADAWNNMGNALYALNKIQDAKIAYKNSISIAPQSAKFQENYSHILLSNFNFSEGWEKYEWRWKNPEFQSKKIKTNRSRWDGRKRNNILLIYGEQGIGDQILYASIFDIFSDYPQKIIVKISEKLVTLFQRSFKNLTFVPDTYEIDDCQFDEYIPIGSLGLHFRPDLSSFSKNKSFFLTVDADRVISFQREIDSNKKLICGVAWKSSNTKIGVFKSMELKTIISQLIDLDLVFVNLQYGDVEKEISDVEKHFKIKIFNFESINNSTDLDEYAALINCCDLVVTTSNTTAHLAGAIGKKTYLLTAYSLGKLWYWQEINGKSLWYPSVKIYQQSKHGDWISPLEKIKFDLLHLKKNYDKNNDRF